MAKGVFTCWICIFILIFAVQEADLELTKMVCQNRVLHLDCAEGEHIVVKEAVFGRTRRVTEHCGTQSIMSCKNAESVHIVAGECDLKQSCTVSATTSKFGNPCPGIWKYLEVKYTCISGTEVRSLCDAESTLSLSPGDHGFLTSPDYPYHPNAPYTCTTQLVTSLGALVDVTVLHGNVPTDSTCSRNHVTITSSGPDDEVVQLCEDVNQVLPLVGLRNITVQYETDGEGGDFGSVSVAKGFSIEYNVRGCLLHNLTIPPNATLGEFQAGERADVQCEEGFRFRSGLTGRCECEGQMWNCNGVLACEVIPCDVELFPVLPHTTPSVIHHGRQVHFVCQHGYVPVNGTLGNLECTNGVWTGEVGECKEAECSIDTVSVPHNMKVALSADGQTLNLRCRYGYEATEGTLGDLLCERGNWTGEIVTCTAVDFPTDSYRHKVAFSTYLSDDVILVTSSLPVPYDVMVLNDANSYDSTTHVFETPLKGVYSFGWSIQGVQGMAQVLVFKNDVIIGGGLTQGMVTSSGQVMLGLEVDDLVWIELRNQDPENDHIVFQNAGFTELPRMTFTGHLLYNL